MRKIASAHFTNLLNDWGFKRYFGEERNKKYLIHFLNEILKGKESVREVYYRPTEHLGKTEEDRKAVFDVYCSTKKGDLILIEMQNMRQTYFKDRSLYYSTFIIQSQAVKGKWNYRLKSVYVIGLLGFRMKAAKKSGRNEKYITRVCLIDRDTGELFYDKLNFVYVELAKFKKTANELNSAQDFWLYTLKHSRMLKEQPEEIKGEIFTELYNEMELKNLTSTEMESYRVSEYKYEDFYNFTDYAEKKGVKKGRREGRKEGKKEVAEKLLTMGMLVDDISKATGLSIVEIHALKEK